MKRLILGDNADVLPTLPEKFARVTYIDPPFNTGKVQKRARIKVAYRHTGLAAVRHPASAMMTSLRASQAILRG